MLPRKTGSASGNALGVYHYADILFCIGGEENMTLSMDVLTTLATLAKIELDDGEKEALLKDLSSMAELALSLKDLDGQGVEASARGLEKDVVYREDIAQHLVSREALLAGAPQRDETSFITPRVLA